MSNKNYNFEEFDEYEEIEDSEILSLNIDTVKEKIPTFDSQKLADMIVCDRYFGLDKEISFHCMEELAKRRLDGDMFDFETYLDTAYNKLPQFSFEMPDLRAVLSQAIKQKNNK